MKNKILCFGLVLIFLASMCGCNAEKADILESSDISVQQKESLMTVVTNFGMLQHMYPRAYFVVKYYLQ